MFAPLGYGAFCSYG